MKTFEEWPLWVKLIVVQMWRKTNPNYSFLTAGIFILIVSYLILFDSPEVLGENRFLGVFILNISLVLLWQGTAINWIERNSDYKFVQRKIWFVIVAFTIPTILLFGLPAYLMWMNS